MQRGGHPPPAQAPKPKSKPKAKTKAKAKACSAKLKGGGPGGDPPPFGTPCPLCYRGCKIYDAVKAMKFRVVPKPGESLYDKAFSYKIIPKKEAWAHALKFCIRPSIPVDSPNYV